MFEDPEFREDDPKMTEKIIELMGKVLITYSPTTSQSAHLSLTDAGTRSAPDGDHG